MSTRIPPVTLEEDDVEMLRLTGDVVLFVVRGLNKPIFLGWDCRDNYPTIVCSVTKVLRFRRPWHSRLLGTRRCSGHIVIRDDRYQRSERHFFFQIGHPIFGYRIAWDKETKLFDTPWDRLPLSEKLGFTRRS